MRGPEADNLRPLSLILDASSRREPKAINARAAARRAHGADRNSPPRPHAQIPANPRARRQPRRPVRPLPEAEMPFDHERLDVYQLSLDFLALADDVGE